MKRTRQLRHLPHAEGPFGRLLRCSNDEATTGRHPRSVWRARFREASESSAEIPRVDEPPYEITEPSCAPDAGRDPLWMCENMPAEPSLAVDQAATSRGVLRNEGVDAVSEANAEQSQYYATLLTDEGDLERVDRESGSDAVELITETDFSTEAVLVVQSGWGSSSTPPHFERIEATDDGIHAFGCHASPCIVTDDYTIRTVVARFERPETLETAAVSLTTGPETRVNFTTTNGIVDLSAIE